jgi:UDP-N-acetylmuramoyl-tripeptide--D-alanyl-D-alanine ligase
MWLSEVAKAVNGQLLGDDVQVDSVGSDSRNIMKNQLFIAINGDHFDGNTFAAEAIKQGASAVLVSDKTCQARPAILVKESILALGALAKSWRDTFTLPVIAITGSNGKTTVKEMLTSILKATCKQPDAVLATVGNLNNHIGMPMTLLKIRKQHAFAVIEMGMNHLGEIDYLTRIAQPTVAVINNAGTAHIGELGSRDNIAKAKGEIFAGLRDDGIVVINADDDYADYWKSLNADKKIITFGLNKAADVSATFVIKADLTEMHLTTPSGSVSFNLAVLGKHNISNALAASAAAVALGINNKDIAQGLGNMQAVYGRLQRKAGFNGAVLIDDTYNANPDSMKAAIDVLATHKNTIFVMGDMAELGENASQMHADIGFYAKQKGIEQLFAFGDLSVKASLAFGSNAQHFDRLENLISALKAQMKQGVTVLIKGSRFMQMERVVKELIATELLEKNHDREKTQCC